MTVTSIPDWRSIFVESLEEMGETMGLTVLVSTTDGRPAAGTPGCYVSLSSESNLVQVGLRSAPDGCRAITGAVLGMEPEDAADLEEGDVVDGIGELVNVLVGLAKTKVAQDDAGLQIGLPIFVQGGVETGGKAVTSWITCDLAGTPCTLAIHAERAPARAA